MHSSLRAEPIEATGDRGAQLMDALVVRGVLGALSGQRPLLLRFAASSLGRTAMVMAIILLMRQFLSAVAAPSSGVEASGGAALWGIAALLVGAYVGASLLDYDNQVVRQRIVKAVELGLMERLVRHLLMLSVGFFDRTSQGDLIQAVRQDVADLRAIVLSCGTLVMESAVALGLAGVAIWMSPSLAVWALLILPLASVPMVLISRRMQLRSLAERRAAYIVFDVILQILRGIRIIKAYQGEEQEVRTTLQSAQRYFDEQIRLVSIRELSNVVLESLAGLSIATVVIVGGVQVMRGTLDWPHLLAFLMAVRMMHGPLDHINFDLMLIQRHRAAAQRIAALLRERPAVHDAPDARPLAAPPRRLAIDGVS